MDHIHGSILTENGFKNGFITIHDHEPATLRFDNKTSSSHTHLIIPPLLNAHTHIGDTFVRKKNISLPADINTLVAPPDGLKHRMLRTTTPEEVIDGMTQGLEELKTHGIDTFIDFRENGVEGISLIQKALQKVPMDALLLGRPNELSVTTKEIDDILKVADGIGLSSVSDWDKDLITLIAEKTKKKNKIFALHASENVREPIKPILDLDPDFIVHMTVASKEDLLAVKAQQIPLIVCPRSNQFFGLKPNIHTMHEIGNTIILGTDNFMLHPPSIIDEIRWIQTNYPTLFSIEELFLMNTYRGRSVLSLNSDQSSNLPTSWLVLNAKTYEIKTILHNVKQP